MASVWSFAAVPAGAPPGSTGLCNDGSYYSGAEKKGACRGHKGVKDRYGEAPTSKAEAAATPAATKPVTPVAPTAPAGTKAATRMPDNTPAVTAAPGGGPGMVWANDSTKVYHCSGDRWYGKTKHGEYMREADAKAKGFHADPRPAPGKRRRSCTAHRIAQQCRPQAEIDRRGSGGEPLGVNEESLVSLLEHCPCRRGRSRRRLDCAAGRRAFGPAVMDTAEEGPAVSAM